MSIAVPPRSTTHSSVLVAEMPPDVWPEATVFVVTGIVRFSAYLYLRRTVIWLETVPPLTRARTRGIARERQREATLWNYLPSLPDDTRRFAKRIRTSSSADCISSTDRSPRRLESRLPTNWFSRQHCRSAALLRSRWKL